MEEQKVQKSLKTIIIDDNYNIRNSLKIFLDSYLKKLKIKYDIFSSSDGVQGVGYIFLISPDIIIVDATLPKYSGRELVEFIYSNKKFTTDNKLIIVINDSKNNLTDLPPNFIEINLLKDDLQTALVKTLDLYLKDENTAQYHKAPGAKEKLTTFLCNRLNRFSFRSDLAIQNYYKHRFPIKFLFGIHFLLLQIASSLIFTFLILVLGKLPKENLIEQQKKDIGSFRARYYPTLTTFFVGTFLIALQFTLFVGGGVTISILGKNYNVKSVFAYGDESKIINFNLDSINDFEFNGSEIEFFDNGIKLKESSAEAINDSLSNQGRILGEVSPDNSKDFYLSKDAYIQTINPLVYKKIYSLIETSSLNNEYTSTLDPAVLQGNYDEVKITYQLSADGLNWLFYDTINNSWDKALLGKYQSSTIQEINRNIESFQNLNLSNSIYIKAYLVSLNSFNTPILESLKINYDVDLVTQVENTLSPDEESFLQDNSIPVSIKNQNIIIERQDENIKIQGSIEDSTNVLKNSTDLKILINFYKEVNGEMIVINSTDSITFGENFELKWEAFLPSETTGKIFSKTFIESANFSISSEFEELVEL